MKKDRLRQDTDDIQNLGDIIEAHGEQIPYDAVEFSEDIDVEEALTFPHPKHKKTEETGLMGSPRIEDMDDEWRMQGTEMQPSDYEEHYSYAVDTYATDDLDEVVEERVHHMGDLTLNELTNEPSIKVIPDKFTPDDGVD